MWIVDDLSSGRLANVPSGAEFVELDIRDAEVRALFREVRFDLGEVNARLTPIRR